MSMKIYRVMIGGENAQREVKVPLEDRYPRPSGPAHMSPPNSGLVQGGLGGPEDELLEAGQEEVFSRAEVESGRIEHHSDTQTRPDSDEIRPSSPGAKSEDA